MGGEAGAHRDRELEEGLREHGPEPPKARVQVGGDRLQDGYDPADTLGNGRVVSGDVRCQRQGAEVGHRIAVQVSAVREVETGALEQQPQEEEVDLTVRRDLVASDRRALGLERLGFIEPAVGRFAGHEGQPTIVGMQPEADRVVGVEDEHVLDDLLLDRIDGPRVRRRRRHGRFPRPPRAV